MEQLNHYVGYQQMRLWALKQFNWNQLSKNQKNLNKQKMVLSLSSRYPMTEKKQKKIQTKSSIKFKILILFLFYSISKVLEFWKLLIKKNSLLFLIFQFTLRFDLVKKKNGIYLNWQFCFLQNKKINNFSFNWNDPCVCLRIF